MNFRIKHFRWNIFFIILFLGLIFVSLFQTFSAIERKKLDSVKISLTARQSMIIQNYAKNFLYFLQTDEIGPLHKSIKAFEATHEALHKGGKAPLDIHDSSRTVELTKSKSPKINQLLIEIKTKWEELKNSAVFLIDEPNRTIDNFSKFNEKTNKLSAMTASVATVFLDKSEENIIYLQKVQIFIFLIAFVLFAISSYLLFKYKKLNDSLEETVIERTAELKEAQGKLVETARSAGMSEIATGVLHNVGNVLNSINVSSEVITDSIIRSSKSNFFKAVDIIRDNFDNFGEFIANDKKGALTLKYIIEYSGVHKKELGTILDELRVLNGNLCHIKNIVSAQQTLSCQTGLIENFTINDVIDHAIQINQTSLSRHDVEVITDIDKNFQIRSDKLKIIQVVTNLISNAKQSITEKNPKSKVINIKVKTDGNIAAIQVTDNGKGIKAENIKKLFEYGFTTKPKGHGFGLHNSALAAKELGGEINVESDGQNKGAQFTLIFPINHGKKEVVNG